MTPEKPQLPVTNLADYRRQKAIANSPFGPIARGVVKPKEQSAQK